MQRLAPHNRVICVEPFHPPLAWLKKSNSVLRRHRRERVPHLLEVQPNLFAYRPRYPYVPFNMRSDIASWLNSPLYKAELRWLLDHLGCRQPWLWAFFAQSTSVLELDFAHVIYDCADDYPPYFPHPAENRFVHRIDEAFCRRAEIVFVGSEPLRQKKAPLNARTFVVNHAADIAHFMKAAAPETQIPEDLGRIPHPRIGFVGMMDGIRFDVDLIGRLAENPNFQIVIVGDFVGELKVSLPRRDNLHLLGMKPVTQLPAYLKGLDVCLMPYRLNETTRHIYPLKLHEYMASGKPIVATAIPAVADFRHLMYVADSPEEFVTLTAAALQEDDGKRVLARLRCAQEHTWENHVQKKAGLIHQYLLPRAEEFALAEARSTAAGRYT